MKLETRVKRLEHAQSAAKQDASYDNWWEFDDHISYFCSDEGKDVFCAHLLLRGEQHQFDTEEELWQVFPSGTKFRRSGGGNFVIVDGVVVRELNFPPSDGKLSPEVQAAIGWLFEEYPN